MMNIEQTRLPVEVRSQRRAIRQSAFVIRCSIFLFSLCALGVLSSADEPQPLSAKEQLERLGATVAVTNGKHTVMIDGGSIHTQVLKALDDLPQIEELYVTETTGTNALLPHIARMPELRVLNLALSDIEEGCLERMGKHEGLESLILSGTSVRDSDLSNLTNFPNLEHLSLDDTPTTHRGWVRIKKLGKLKALDVGGTWVDDAGLADLAEIKTLRSLGLRSGILAKITDRGMEDLAKLPNLRELALTRGRITDAGLKHLTNLPNLQKLGLIDTRVTDAGIESLTAMKQLDFVDVRRTRLSPAGIEKLRKARPKTYVLDRSVLRGDDIPPGMAIRATAASAPTQRLEIAPRLLERRTPLSAPVVPNVPSAAPRLKRQSPRHSPIVPKVSAATPRLERRSLHFPSTAQVVAAATAPVARYVRTPIGVTNRKTPIEARVYDDEDGLRTRKTRILLVGDGSIVSRDAIGRAEAWFYFDEEAKKYRADFLVSVVANPYPDGLRDGVFRFPPQGTAYANDGDPEAAYLWRWIGMHAPDLMVRVDPAKAFVLSVPKTGIESLERLRKQPLSDATFHGHSLVAQLVKTPPADVGIVPAAAVGVGKGRNFMPKLLSALQKAEFTGPSPARKELQQRLDRTPLEVAEQLAKVYGHDLNSVVYIPAVAAIGQVRLAKRTGDAERLAAVEKIAAPYVAGDKTAKTNSHVAWAGHLVFAELADATDNDARRDKYIQLAQAAADAVMNDDGTPDLNKLSGSRMSDAMFMGGPILARVGHLSGEAKYFDAAAAHAQNIAAMLMRDDGLYRHSPLDEAAWGRGNGFAALGLAMMLDHLPEEHDGRDRLLALFRQHMAALRSHQDYTGAWHQVIDREESYRELSCTCMITYAMIRGVRDGWLEREKYEPIIERAWHAIRTRVAADGTLVDVCAGTGKQKSLRAYYDRPAILGRDERGGAMALLAATEMAVREQEKRGRSRQSLQPSVP